MKSIKKVFLFSILSFSIFTAYAQGYVENPDKPTLLSNEEQNRNAEGECDSSCDVLAPIPAFSSTPVPTTFSQAIRVSETQDVTCPAAGFPADYQGVATNIRYYYQQNGARVPGTETPWTLHTHTCRPPFPCNVQNVSWTVGSNTCSGPTTGVIAHNATGSANSTAFLRTGTGTFSCFDGTLSYVSGTCLAGCTSQVRTWTQTTAGVTATCTGTTNAVNHNQTSSINASVGIGNGSFLCTDGSWSTVATSCTQPIEATGCEISETTIGATRYRLHTCRPEHNGQLFTVINPGAATETIDFLVVGAGGGGGAPRGGGGGGGGVYRGNIRINTAQSFGFQVGVGGIAGTAGSQTWVTGLPGYGGYSRIFNIFSGGGAPGSYWNCGNGSPAYTASDYGLNATWVFARGAGGGAGGCGNDKWAPFFTASGGGGINAGGGNQGAKAGGGGGGVGGAGQGAKFNGPGERFDGVDSNGNDIFEPFVYGENNVLGHGGRGIFSDIDGINRQFGAGGDPGGIAGTCASGANLNPVSYNKKWVCGPNVWAASKINGNCGSGENTTYCLNNTGRGGDGGSTTTVAAETWNPGGAGRDGVIILRYRISN